MDRRASWAIVHRIIAASDTAEKLTQQKSVGLGGYVVTEDPHLYILFQNIVACE